ncbi:MAG: SDR family NAD(P)-dependent oxidoreductase [Syntrophaceticus sp.]|nr:SDR family NAD(P)-dependent oxidoreductase [Syntrophaceticus sp.]
MADFRDDFEGKVVIVTGAASGLGEATALGFGNAGAKVVVADKKAEEGSKVSSKIKEMGTDSIFVETDVTCEDSIKNMIDKTLSSFGGLDILVNNAGTGGPHLGNPFTRTEAIDWDTSYKVNVRGTFYCCKAVYDMFIKQRHGKIINLASIAGKTGDPTIPHYSASKAAVINLTQNLARELAPYNINVNCVCPGLIYTPIWKGLGYMMGKTYPEQFPNMSPREVFLANIDKLVPMKREQTAEDIANAVLFLCSEAAKNITAQALNVCGGAEIK